MSTKTTTIVQPGDLRPGDRAQISNVVPGMTTTINGVVAAIRRADETAHGFDSGWVITYEADQVEYPVRTPGSDWTWHEGTREEPERKPGTTGTATVWLAPDGDSVPAEPVRDVRGTWITSHAGVLWFATHEGSVPSGNLVPAGMVTDFVPARSATRLMVTKAVTEEELADVLAQHYGDHENLAAVPSHVVRENYLYDARTILDLLGGGTR